MAIIKNTTINDIGFIRVPSGTTAQRPSNPDLGSFRYNTSTTQFEVFDGSNWRDVRNQ
jgi:hypothetical protein